MPTMVPVSTEFLREVTALVADVQGPLKKLAQIEKTIEDRGRSVADQLVQAGLLNPGREDSKVAAYLENPELGLLDLGRIAPQVKAASLGGPSGNPDADGAEDGLSADEQFEQDILQGPVK